MKNEADVKSEVIRYLDIRRRLGELTWDQLNSGEIFVNRRRIKLCKEGTFDIMVLMKGQLYYIDTKHPKTGKPTPEQLEFKAEVEKHGAKCLFATNVNQVRLFLGDEVAT